MRTENKELKVSLMKALIERGEFVTKESALQARIESLNQKIQNAEKESDLMMNCDEIEQFCDRFSLSNQMSVLNKIQDAKCQLIKYGINPYTL